MLSHADPSSHYLSTMYELSKGLLMIVLPNTTPEDFLWFLPDLPHFSLELNVPLNLVVRDVFII